MSSIPHSSFQYDARSALIGLQCHLCKATFRPKRSYVCDKCLGPLEPVYDYAAIRVTREEIERRPKNLWRYRELLPITGEPLTGFNSGFTPLVRCDRLADRLGSARAVLEGRLGQSSDPVVQGPRRLGRGDSRRGAGLQGAVVRLDREPRQQRVGARRPARSRMLRVHSRQSRAGQDSRARPSTARRFSPSPATTTT